MSNSLVDKPKLRALYGVYDADATIWGEMSYWLGARFGFRHCSLCDITHSLFRKKSAWQDCQRQLADKYNLTFHTFHRNDQPEKLKPMINGNYPAVVAEDINGRLSIFMDDLALKECNASPELFLAQIIKRLPQ
ncbi:MAG: hypothetical protein O3C50_01330 [Actinomycetota bacterium]|nr:hypothetical protein [Actinomycetota bacterium]MDA2997413.1 hypothetical protein [Actinomycetota bacterium]MDA3036163.1 hypothetical protein [Actinomycetota bacterium]